MMENIIVLLTDFGEGSIYVGQVKGVIISINPNAMIIDLTHNVRPQNIIQGAFLLKESYKFFPKGSIFFCVIDPEVGSKRKALAVKTRDYIFVGPDNGLLYPAAMEDQVQLAVSIENEQYTLKSVSSTFDGRDIFASVVAHLSRGLKISELGSLIDSLHPLQIPDPIYEGDAIVSKVIFIDNFGNIVTNVNKIFCKDENLSKIKSITLLVGSRSYELPFVKSYSQVSEGLPLTLFNSFGCLEISVNKGNASQYFNIKDDDQIKILLMS